MDEHSLTIYVPSLPYYDSTALVSFVLYDFHPDVYNMIRTIPPVVASGWGSAMWGVTGFSGVLNITDTVQVYWTSTAIMTTATIATLIADGTLIATSQPWALQPSGVLRVGVLDAVASYPVNYTIHSRKTERLGAGGRLDQERDVTVLVEALKRIFVFLHTYKVDWEILSEDTQKQEFCKVFLDKIHPAFSSYEVYAEKRISEVANITVPTDTVTLDLSLISYFSLGISALGKGALK